MFVRNMFVNPMFKLCQRSERSIMGALFAVVAVDAIGMGVILPLLPFYSKHYGASPLAVGLLVACGSLAQAVAAPYLGRWSDRIGRKQVLLISQVGTLASLCLLGAATSLVLIFAARILDGLTAGNISVASAFAVDRSTPATRKQAIGLISAAIGVGLIVGPALSGILAGISLTAPVLGAVSLSFLSLAATALLLPGDWPVPAATPVSLAPSVSMRQVLAAPGTSTMLGLLGAFFFAFSMYMSQLALFAAARFQWQGTPIGVREVGWLFTLAGALNVIVQLFLIRRIGAAIADERLVVIALMGIGVGFVLLGLSTELPALFLAIGLISLASSLLRPTLMSTLTLTAAPGMQGALMGVTTSVMATTSVAAPIAAGQLIGQGHYTGWALAIAAIFVSIAIASQILVSRGMWPIAVDTPIVGA